MQKEKRKTTEAISAMEQQQDQLQRVRAEMAEKAKSDDAIARRQQHLIEKEKAMVEKAQAMSETESNIDKKLRKISVKESEMAAKERAMTEKVQSMQEALAELEEQRGAALAYGVALFFFWRGRQKTPVLSDVKWNALMLRDMDPYVSKHAAPTKRVDAPTWPSKTSPARRGLLGTAASDTGDRSKFVFFRVGLSGRMR